MKRKERKALQEREATKPHPLAGMYRCPDCGYVMTAVEYESLAWCFMCPNRLKTGCPNNTTGWVLIA